MLRTRPSYQRGKADFGWLQSRHTFSFGQYRDPAHMGHGPLRVINEDHIAPGQGFGTHPHRDMEIITYVVSGALQHRDSLGTGSVLVPGDVQAMSAGTGVQHSEFNPSRSEPVHLLQIWILPDKTGLEPRYQQTAFSSEDKLNDWCLLASRDGRDRSIAIHQDIAMLGTVLEPGHSLDWTVNQGRLAWLQLIRGDATLNNLSLSAGDGVAIQGPESLQLAAEGEVEVLLFDMAPWTAP